jgi:hypothetical protein
MELDDTRWPKIQAIADVLDPEARSAPKAVVVAVNSIIGDLDRAAAWSSMDTTESSTTWSCWVVTECSIGHVRIEYEKYLYDQGEEPRSELTPSGWSAWVRPLADIVGLRYGAFYAAQGEPTIFEPAGPITVIFTNGEISIPEGPVPVEQRAAADRIFSAIRAGVNF